MKLRQHRHSTYALMHFRIFEQAYWQRVIERSRALLAKQWEGLSEMLELPTLSQEVAGGPVTIHEDEPTPLVVHQDGEPVLFSEEETV